ncbi:DUF6221 family protein [Streptomyces vinaceus]|uniref:DUF6221 family protein n=1 Tax=Streptomyces vinaceus TaxID=1960 RepID=UPI0037FB486E
MSAALLAFLHARLAEDAQAAAAASDGPWTPWRGKSLLHGLGQLEHAVMLPGQGVGSRASIATASWMDSEHIARHHPARVLAEVEAKRQLVDRYERVLEDRRVHPDDLALAGALLALHGAVKLLALPYADHPDYLPELAPDRL